MPEAANLRIGKIGHEIAGSFRMVTCKFFKFRKNSRSHATAGRMWGIGRAGMVIADIGYPFRDRDVIATNAMPAMLKRGMRMERRTFLY